MSENRRRRNNGAQNTQVKKARTNNARRILLLVGLMSLVAVISIGGTIAWLTASSDQVVNTFTSSDINVTLTETNTNADNDGSDLTNSYKMVLGSTISKDPKVKVEAGSEACWLFVKIEKSTTLDNYISYTVADGWTQLTGVSGVYYREVTSSQDNQSFDVIGYVNGSGEFVANKVLVKDSVTKTMMEDLAKDGAVQPTLTFTAYACQKDNVSTAADAWAKLNPGT